MGNLIGIVAEYNPFHAGHAYQIRRAREIAGEESTVIAVMSGDFVQRGSWAIQPKAVRARAACEGGADAVFELPLFCPGRGRHACLLRHHTPVLWQ